MFGTGLIRLLVDYKDLSRAQQALALFQAGETGGSLNKKSKFHIWKWRIYFLIDATFVSVSAMNFFFHQEHVFGFDFLMMLANILVNTICTIGLYGYAFNRKIFNARFWSLFFYIYMLYGIKNTIYGLYVIIHDDIPFTIATIAGLLVGVTYLGISMVALYWYPFRIREQQAEHFRKAVV